MSCPGLSVQLQSKLLSLNETRFKHCSSLVFMANYIEGILPGVTLPLPVLCHLFHRFLTTAEKVFKEATLADSLQDEERAYCLYMRYFNIITAIKKTDEFKKNEVVHYEYLRVRLLCLAKFIELII